MSSEFFYLSKDEGDKHVHWLLWFCFFATRGLVALGLIIPQTIPVVLLLLFIHIMEAKLVHLKDKRKNKTVTMSAKDAQALERGAPPPELIELSSEAMVATVDQLITAEIAKELAFLREEYQAIIECCHSVREDEVHGALPTAEKLAYFHRVVGALGLLGRYKLPKPEDVEFFEKVVKDSGIVEVAALRELASTYVPNILSNALAGGSNTWIDYAWQDITRGNNFYATFLAIRSVKRVVAMLKEQGFDVNREQDTKRGVESVKIGWSQTCVEGVKELKKKLEQEAEAAKAAAPTQPSATDGM